jgi:homoserine acetyltransferase
MRLIRRNVAAILAISALFSAGLSLGALEAAHWAAAARHSVRSVTLIEACANNLGSDATLIEA